MSAAAASWIHLLTPSLCFLPLGSTHLGDPRATSNPGSPPSSPHTPSALGSGISDPVLNGGLCSAAYCSSAGGEYAQIGNCYCRRRQSITLRGPRGKPLRDSEQMSSCSSLEQWPALRGRSAAAAAGRKAALSRSCCDGPRPHTVMCSTSRNRVGTP